MIPLSRSALIAAACATLATGAVQAQTKTLYIGMNGGNMEKTFTQFVFGPFEQKHNVKVVVVPGGSADILAKAQAAKDKPQMHVMFLDDGVMYRAVGMGLCEKQKPNPNLAGLLPVAHIKDDMATGVTISVTGLAYNTKVFADKGWAPPTSWLDLADPKYKGKVVFQSLPSSTFGLHAFLAFNQLKGGTDANVEPGFKAWPSTIGPNVVEYISNSAKISEMAQTGEAALFPYTPTQSTILKSKGIPVEYVQPKEGAVVLMVAQCVIANNSEPQLAQELAAYLLSPEAQAKALENGSYNPTNTKVQVTGAAAAEQKRMNEIVKNSRSVDWDEVNKNRSAWNTRWNRSVER
ncbi:ABC transporter substrate-binding protein [Herbaspirillum robiniae]|uniref:ABC transporter substrate-binding protein n=1 Tax=Herbaspirillum robiniae TaxID=2014887 RepID=A0A246WKK9_9BURK|nr:ABC transporter substrate-binding protein [Herbaspirillum robiniae]NUU02116.1 ABC transporter substrate-binding protein [Herbaspirillum robiniae]OWY26861.1 spermidine/putrescine ABC transporter substrate-binding protein [Herbaspirillum robiniae]